MGVKRAGSGDARPLCFLSTAPGCCSLVIVPSIQPIIARSQKFDMAEMVTKDLELLADFVVLVAVAGVKAN